MSIKKGTDPVNIKRAKEEIKDTIAAYLLKDEFGEYKIPAIRQRPVLLIGPPGVGKTQIMEQIARECEIGLVAYTITHHTRQSAVGLPFIEHKIYGGKEYSVTEYTMSEIIASVYDRIRETGLKEGILFIDEINCVSETLAPTMLQFLQCKTFGSHKVPEGWIIVAAGNPPEYNKSVREFDVVTLDRIKKIIIEPDLNVWKEYAYAQNIHPAIMSYLNIRPQYFCTVETTVDGKRFATPRGWEDLSQLIQVYESLGKKADRDVVGQYLQHPKIAKDFANYLELYYKYQDQYQVDEILSGTIREGICDKLDLLIWLIADSMGPVLTTYTAQNLGAGKAKRVKKGALIGTGLSVIAVGIISIVLYFGSGLIGPLFIDQKDVPTLIPLVIRYMQMMAPFFVFYAVAAALSGACSGLGETLVSMVTTLLTICLFRVVCILVVLPSFETMECIVWIYIGSWIVSGVTFTILYLAKVEKFYHKKSK